jgi:ferredoxin-NADP reductase
VDCTKREEVAEGTMAFRFEKPRGFHFQAGQFITLTLLDPPETDAEGNTRAFSIASAPYERELMIATRIRGSALKRCRSQNRRSGINLEKDYFYVLQRRMTSKAPVLPLRKLAANHCPVWLS